MGNCTTHQENHVRLDKNEGGGRGGRKNVTPKGRNFMAHRLWSISVRVIVRGMIKFRIDSPLIAILLCDTRREWRVTSVSGDNNNAVINPLEVSWNGGLIMHAKCSRNPHVEPHDEIESQHSRRFC